ncbi:stage V sporulation protein D (sporulation-specific penicillin-binding protein) [Desulfitispora alkaliphila]|uniref:stage V sporulation protein D n=1 Tax=Desulfitispora alkaliphila TaxID=622674 RepID=UPI003D1DD2AF
MSDSANIISRKRIAVIFLIATLIFVALGARLAWLQIVKGEELHRRAFDNRMRDIEVLAKRGTIYDRNGKELAVSVSADTVIAIPPQVRQSEREEEIAQAIADILELEYEAVLDRISKRSSFEYIKRRVDFDKAQKIKDLDFPGIAIIEENQRFYPKDTLASHVLGFAGIDNQGLEGIEITYEKELKGVSGRIRVEYDAGGREIPHALHKYIPPVPGHNLILTIDEVIQYVVERELDKVIAETQAKSATIILMKPDTGEILALGSRPAYNPNSFGQYPSSTWRNIAVSNNYEPGSTFKIITLAAAIEEGIFDPNKGMSCAGSIKIGRETIRCHRTGGHGSQTYTEVVENSCNPGFIKLGLSLEEKQQGLLYQYIKGFGFGKQTGIRLPGEATGIMIPESQLKQINNATISMGQAIAVTPIQLVSAVSAVANGGVLMEPQLVKEIRDHDGKLIEKLEPKVVRKVASKQSMDLALEILESVVENGTGRNTYIEGYRIAGKTGTAQKVAESGGYAPGKYVASFVGLAPADNPQVVGLVVVDEPQGAYYGGQIAAPVFKNVMVDVLRYLEVAPKYSDEERENNGQTKEVATVQVPNVVNMDLNDAENKLRQEGLRPERSGEGDYVVAQTPASGARVLQNSRIILYLDNEQTEPEENGTVVVPDVKGKTIREAAQIFNSIGLKMQVVEESSGLAIEQSVDSGKRVPRETVIKVKFEQHETTFSGP